MRIAWCIVIALAAVSNEATRRKSASSMSAAELRDFPGQRESIEWSHNCLRPGVPILDGPRGTAWHSGFFSPLGVYLPRYRGSREACTDLGKTMRRG